MRAIKITTNDEFEEVDIDVKTLSETYDFYAPFTTLRYPLCVGVRLLSTYKENELIKVNTRANKTFNQPGQYFGDVYIFLDADEPEDDDEDEPEDDDVCYLKNPLWTFENLIRDISNYNLVY